MWESWRQYSSNTTVEVRHIVLDDIFGLIVEFVEPICDMLNVDTDSPCLGEIYENCLFV